uniref:J domain-containing protein n=1 Tax=Pseudo-nitzschia australis TaxID=44445 RepID=A0A7S4AKP7_9STRA
MVQRMNRLLSNTRHCRIPVNADGVRSIVGHGATTDVNNYQCSFPTTTNSTNATHQQQGASSRTQPHGTTFLREQIKHRPPFRTLIVSSTLHQRQQLRFFVFDSRKARKTKQRKDPFKVLKIPKVSFYKDVKRKFLKIAMSNHPDTHSDGLTEKEKEAMRDKFIEARMAFEMLAEDPEDGTAILVEEMEDRDSNFNSWFRNETGLKNPFDVDIDPETMKEVAEMTEKLGGSQGMDRDGGSK